MTENIVWNIEYIKSDNIYKYCLILYIDDILTSYITFFIRYEINNKSLGTCNITDLWTHINHRHKGHAYNLLSTCMRFCKIHFVRYIELDDCTDLFNKKNNIYLKLGFKYTENGHPEMIYYL